MPPTLLGSMYELSMLSQKPRWGHGHAHLCSRREEKENRAGWNKDGLGCARSHEMGPESFPCPCTLGQANFCKAASDWTLKALTSSFCRSWPFSAEVQPCCHVRGAKYKRCLVVMHQKPSGRLVAPLGVGFGGRRWAVVRAHSSLGCSSPCYLPPGAPAVTTACFLTRKRNSREVLTWFCCYRLKHNLVSGRVVNAM